MLGKITGINRVGISSVENDLEPLGEQRAKIIGNALEIPEDVMSVYGVTQRMFTKPPQTG